MAAKKTRRPLFERLKKSLEEGIEFSRGNLNLRTVEIPEEPPEVDARTVKALRHHVKMSQAVFAGVLNVSTKTVQGWEQGLRKPSQASLRLIEVLSRHPEVLCELAGLKDVPVNGGFEIVPVGARKKLVARKSSPRRKSAKRHRA